MAYTSHQPVDEKLKQDLINRLLTKSVYVKVFLGKKLIESHTIEISNHHKIFITYPAVASELPLPPAAEAECHFAINQEMYFFKGTVAFIDQKLAFNAPSIIYKIQRRENFRVYIPPAVLQNIELVNEKGSKATMNNLSLTGCQLSVKNADLNLALDRYKLNNDIKIKVTMLDFQGQVFNCVIKFVDSSKSGVSLLGVQFQNLDAVKTQQLQTVIAKIDRLNRQVAA